MSPDHQGPWWRHLTPYHWFVFAMASMAWLFDCLDQQIFNLFRQAALQNLMPEGTDGSVIKTYGGYATSIFVAGWATGGLIFGSLGDKYGRAKMLTLTVLLYSVFTGLSALSTGWLDFALYRFVTGLGVGGVFGLAVALVADSLPEHSRTGALGLLQALSALGNIAAGLISMWIGKMITSGGLNPATAWKMAFLVGAIPAFLCVFIQMRLKEPEKWVKAHAASRAAGKGMGSYRSLLGEARWRHPALLGMLLCISGVIGLWGIGFFSFELVGDVISQSLRAKGTPDTEIAGAAAKWKGINGIIQNTGAFFGMMSFAWLAQKVGRKPTFAISYLGALAATWGFFSLFGGVKDVWMSGVMGFFQLALFGGFAIYLPELFPTRLRSTGTSFCYNVGRFLAASGPFTMGKVQAALAQGAESPEAKLAAFRQTCQWMSLIFLVGLVALAFLPETKGKPLPEDLDTGEEFDPA
ncbi:MAG: MFS transporter [Verrucomicrobiae bacterium]|nr:MFS transporter [Verrucomicrobiae bacterium]MCP5538676.1 MFS transporter [Akkermansiaceae bacterium]